MNHLPEKLSSLLAISFMAILAGCSDNSKHTGRYAEDAYEIDGRNSYYEEPDYDSGYEWAEENEVESFDECDEQFGTSEAEDGCNKYVQKNMFEEPPTYYGDDCTEDCSGHVAGYQWAEDNGIDDPDDCDGNSDSFIEGCQAYAEEQ